MSPLGTVCVGYMAIAVVLAVVCYILAPEKQDQDTTDLDNDLDRLR